MNLDTLTVKHLNMLSSLKDDANRISCWKNIFNCHAYFKLYFLRGRSFLGCFSQFRIRF